MAITKNIVVIGGGTGTASVLSGLKTYNHLNLSAIITVADSGGSTGRLRDEFGFQAVGDLRQALASLTNDNSQVWVKKVLLYRFNKGSGLEGHNLGNLILTALQDMTGSTYAALNLAMNMFDLKGRVIPITNTNINLVIEYEDGSVEMGESILDSRHGGEKIVTIKTSPRAYISTDAKDAIEAADYIIIGPGDLYGSLMANLVTSGVKEAFWASSAKIIYISNLMTHYTQTHQMSAKDHLSVIEDSLGKKVDYIIQNNQPFSSAVLSMYAKDNEYPVQDDLNHDARVIRIPLLKNVVVNHHKADKVKRSYLRHDQHKLASGINKIISEN